MSDVTNNEENVADETTVDETVVAEAVAEAVVEAAVEEAVAEVIEEAVAEAVVEAIVEDIVEEAVEEVVEAAPKKKAPAVEATKASKDRDWKPAVVKTVTSAATEVTEVEDDGTRENARKIREGIVVSDKMNQTVVVAVNERVAHPRYAKTVQRTKKLYVHDQNNDAKVGDRVRVQETRPLSKLKRWRLTEVVERAR